MSVPIRPATPVDAAPLATFAAHAFRDWYAADNTPADLDLHLARTFGATLQGEEIADPRNLYLLAHQDSTIIGYGFLRIGTAHAAIAAQTPCEVRRFYVDRSQHGQGVSGALMDAAVAAARERRVDVLWLTAWERNPRALGFYAKMGFVDVGSATFMLGTSRQVDRVLRLVL